MQKIGNITNTATAQGEWTNGKVSHGVTPTIIDAAWLNTIQRELVNVVEEAGVDLDPTNDSQLLYSIKNIITGNAVPQAKEPIPVNKDLNDVIDTGEYFQSESLNATPERHYPISLAGTLIVYKTGVDNAGCRQVYMPYNSTNEYRRVAYGKPLIFSGWEEKTGGDIRDAALRGDLAHYDGLKYIGRCPDIATLRTLEVSVNNQFINVIEYYAGSGIGGGWFQYDDSDTMTKDDGITCIVTTNGARFKPILSDGKIYASRTGLGNGIDQTEIWKKFCAVEYDKVIDVDIVISGEGILAAGTSLIAIKDAKITLSASVTDTVTRGSEAHCLVASSNCKVRDVKIDGNSENFFDGAGILVSYANNVEIAGCTFTNTSGIGMKFYYSSSIECFKNKIISCRHGIEGWLATSLKIHDNHVTNISHDTGNNGGGIWFAVCQDVSVYDNYIADCADVGIDFEGGTRCYAHNNFVTRCRNGELTVFGTGYQSDLQSADIVMGDIEFRENRVIRDYYANNRSGTAVNNSLADVAGEMVYGGLDLVQNGTIRFIRNEIRVIATTGNSLYCHRSRTSDTKGTARIVQDGCIYETVSGRLINWYDRQDREFHNCTLKFIGNAATIVMGELRDVRTLLSRDIKINIDTTAIVSSYPLTLNNSPQVIAGELEFSGWVFRGHTGSYLHIDQTFITRTVTIGNMDFDDAGGMVDLPISIGAGNIRWKNQKFRIKIPAGTMTYSFVKGIFYQSNFTAINCYIWLSLDSKKKCGYRFALVNDLKDTMYLSVLDESGKARTGIKPSSLCYATFSGNTVDLTQTGSQSLSAIIELNIDSVD